MFYCYYVEKLTQIKSKNRHVYAHKLLTLRT